MLQTSIEPTAAALPALPALRVSPNPHGVAAPTLALRGLACRRGARRLFASLDLELRPAELLWLRAANGHGKTSLLRLIAGLAMPERGEIRIDGMLVGGASAAPVSTAPHGIVYIGHANALKDDLTVREALGFLLRIHGRACDRACVDAALDHWNLLGRADAAVRTLSQGQRRRLALARLVGERAPALWLLDEPCDALDSDGVERLNALLAAHLQRGGSVLLTGHHAPLAATLPVREFDLDRVAANVCHSGASRNPGRDVQRASEPGRPSSSIRALFAALFVRDLRLALRRRTDSLLPVAFFVVAVALFPLGVGPEPETLRQIAPGLIWVCALLATMLSVAPLYAADHVDGTLEQLLLTGQSAVVVASERAAAHWLLTGAPLVVGAPLFGLMFGLDLKALAVLTATLLLGTPILSLLGALGAALTLGLRSAGALLLLIVLPLAIPALIFGTGAVAAV
ncbi:MAG: heme exporter protein CcmB, partial [Caldimonas sp.]